MRNYWSELSTKDFVTGYLLPHAGKRDMEGDYKGEIILLESAKRIAEASGDPELVALVKERYDTERT